MVSAPLTSNGRGTGVQFVKELVCPVPLEYNSISSDVTEDITPRHSDVFYAARVVTLGGLVVVCFPLDPTLCGSNPAEGDGFLRAIKSVARHPSRGK
jgi:hypothetical protein